MLVYKITNLINGKVYVGQTVQSLRKRWMQHKYGAGPQSRLLIGRAICKHGYQNFKVEELCGAETTEELNFLEMLFITILRTQETEWGYNIFDGGRNSGDEARRNRSVAKLGTLNHMYGRTHTGETRAKIADKALGRKHTADSKRKLSARFSGEANNFFGRRHTPGSIERMRTAHLGKPGHRPSAEGIERIRKALTGRKVSADTSEKLRKVKQGFKMPDETKRKIATSVAAIERTPVWRQRISVAMTGRVFSQEHRERISAARQKYPIVTRSCLQCSTDFRISDRLKKKFCSSACYRSSRGSGQTIEVSAGAGYDRDGARQLFAESVEGYR